MHRRLHIIGTSGLAKEVAQLADTIRYATSAPVWDEIVYISQDTAEVGKTMPFGVVAGTDALLLTATEPIDVAIGIGLPAVRRRVARVLGQLPHLCFPNLIHPKALVDQRWVRLGIGNIVAAGCVFTCDVEAGDFNLFNLNVTVGHDARIGSYNVFNPGCNLSGNIRIHDACLAGTGSQVLERIQLASDCTLGAGGVLTKSCNVEGTVLTGIPARPRA